MNWLHMRATSTPKSPAIICAEGCYTYQELAAHVNRAAHLLVEDGVKSGQHVAVMLPTCAEYIVIIHALSQVGAVLVPLNLRLDIKLLRDQLGQANCTHIVSSPKSNSVAKQLAMDFQSTSIDDLVDLRTPATPSALSPDRQWSLMASVENGSIHSIIFTSGTTGHPRGVQLTYTNHFASATASAYRLGVLPSDRWLLCMPLWHVGGLAIVLRTCIYGIALVIMEHGFHVSVLRDILKEECVTLVSLVPTMLHRLINLPNQDNPPDSLRCVLLGGDAASKTLLSQALTSRWPIAVTYGLTEASSQVATASPTLTSRKPGCAGKPLVGVGMQICSPTGDQLPANKTGEIVVSGSTLMHGYCGQPEATHKVMRNSRLYTGDLAYLDSQGDLWVVQRISDMIISGGENINPHDVETILCEHPAIKQACVVGLDDPEWGQQVGVLVVGANLTPEDLQKFWNDKLAYYQQPRVVQFVEELPLTKSGKLRRTTARKILARDSLARTSKGCHTI